jgi:hypothetical protein
MGSLSEDARSLREEQLDAMSPLELANMADAGRKKLEGVDDRLKDKISDEFMIVLSSPKIGVVSAGLSVNIDINGRVVVCGALRTRTVEEGPMALQELPGALGIDNLQIDVHGSSTSPLLVLRFDLKDYIQAKRKEGGFGGGTPVAEDSGETELDNALRNVAAGIGAQFAAANPAFAGQDAGVAGREGSEFSTEDVGNFLQRVLGDRLAEDGGSWDVEGVTVTRDEKNGVVIGGLNHNQRGTRWVKGVQSVQFVFELLAGKGYNASYGTGVSTVTISESEFAETSA